MDDVFALDDDDDVLDLDSRRRHRPRPRLSLDAEYRPAVDKIYFVPYRWWNEPRNSLLGDAAEVAGVLYIASSSTSSEHSSSEILLNMRRDVASEKSDKKEEGFSGGEYALVSEGMWLRVLKWYNDSNVALANVGSISAVGDSTRDVFPLQVRLSVLRNTNSLMVKINEKDNSVEHYKRACDIFCVRTGMLHIWDFSGQTTLFFSNDRTKLPNHPLDQLDEGLLLELHVYGSSSERQDEMAVEHPRMDSGSLKMNGSTDNMDSYLMSDSCPQLCSGYSDSTCVGLTGLLNLGNTCFMNCAIQCLVHTLKLVEYFLGDYRKDINYENPLGMHGELALAFGDLLRKLWVPGAMPVAPRMFKLKLSGFSPQFIGFNQHDSQEFLAFLLDGLHEDLNRVKSKPYIELGDVEGRPSEEVADEYWQNHLARNDSIIVDVCQGQYQSTLVCPICKKVSVTFDPFMYLSLPLPSTTMRSMTLTVVSTDGISLPLPLTITVPKFGRCKDLIEALSDACSLRNDEMLLVAEIYNNRILRYLEEPSDLLSLIRDDDRLVAYRLPKDSESSEASYFVVFVHARMEKDCTYGRTRASWKMFGVPLVAKISDISSGSCIRKLFMKLIDPFVLPNEDVLSDCDADGNTASEDAEMRDVSSPTVLDDASTSDSDLGSWSHLGSDFQFYLTDEKVSVRGFRIKMNEPVSVLGASRRLYVNVCWPEKLIEQYDTCLLSSLPEIFSPGLFSRRPQESVSLYKCLEAFLREEPLGPEDMWYCPGCEQHRQANKKLDLWRLPEILIIHLKRFSYFQFYKSKMETLIDFPIDDLDLSCYVTHKYMHQSDHYSLYAICNHYGGMGGGHYTAFVRQGHNLWYEFDDSFVSRISEDQIKTSAAYVLFYKRVTAAT